MYRGSIQTVGGTHDAPTHIYYNADIINNNTNDRAGGLVTVDPQIRFSETRDSAIVKDSSEYFFSIVRFDMNGANKDLPLFIPTITAGTGQTNVDWTVYACAIAYQQRWQFTDIAPVTFTIAPDPRFVIYTPETQNPVLAPTPRTMAVPNFAGVYNPALTYQTGQIVGTTLNVYGAVDGPFYQAIQPVPLATAPPNPAFWLLVPGNIGNSQDLSSRYYWVYTYQHMVDLVNQTLTQAHLNIYNEFAIQWAATGTVDPFPYPTFASFQAVVNTPQMVFNPDNHRFRIYGDSDGFGQRITAFTPVAPGVTGPLTAPQFRLFFNSNMYGLFSNFNNTFYETPLLPGFNLVPTSIPVNAGYTNEILFTNKFYQNVADYRIPPFAGVAPLGYVPIAEQKPYWVAEQDYASDDSLWSPIGSIVFTSTLLPIKTEATGQPLVLGNGNLGFSSATSQNAFQPIITDIALDTSQPGGASEYRTFVSYAPTAEYRLADLSPSRQEIRNIDIQVYWKNRLDSSLNPINMFNLSSVSIKVLFRRRDYNSGKE
jgi:hypothetical protein